MIISASRICTARMKPRSINNLSMSHGRGRANLQKLIGAQRGAAHQPAVHIRHREQLGRIRGFDAAAVQNAQIAALF